MDYEYGFNVKTLLIAIPIQCLAMSKNEKITLTCSTLLPCTPSLNKTNRTTERKNGICMRQ